jgi:hypothetical protein
VAQAVGHVATVPEQRNGAQAGEPAAVEERIVQVPSAVAPRAAAQASQAPLQALSQQKPSEQEFVRH